MLSARSYLFDQGFTDGIQDALVMRKDQELVATLCHISDVLSDDTERQWEW